MPTLRPNFHILITWENKLILWGFKVQVSSLQIINPCTHWSFHKKLCLFKFLKCLFVFLKSKKCVLVNIYLVFSLSKSFILVLIMLFWCFSRRGWLYQVYNVESDHVSRYFGIIWIEKSLTWSFGNLTSFVISLWVMDLFP